jgi:hypothetical protein
MNPTKIKLTLKNTSTPSSSQQQQVKQNQFSYVFPDCSQEYCEQHKQEGMINRKHCAHENCSRLAYYGTGQQLYCSEHKPANATDNIHTKCHCGKFPSFGNPGEKTPTRCEAHKSEGMIRLKTKYCECGKPAYFGIPGSGTGATHCGQHKLEDMADLRRKLCEQNSCHSRALFGFTKATHCDTHKEPGMININNKRRAPSTIK